MVTVPLQCNAVLLGNVMVLWCSFCALLTQQLIHTTNRLFMLQFRNLQQKISVVGFCSKYYDGADKAYEMPN